MGRRVETCFETNAGFEYDPYRRIIRMDGATDKIPFRYQSKWDMDYGTATSRNRPAVGPTLNQISRMLNTGRGIAPDRSLRPEHFRNIQNNPALASADQGVEIPLAATIVLAGGPVVGAIRSAAPYVAAEAKLTSQAVRATHAT